MTIKKALIRVSDSLNPKEFIHPRKELQSKALFVVSIKIDEGHYYILDGCDGSKLHLRKWDDEKRVFSENAELDINLIDDNSISGKCFYRNYEYDFKGIRGISRLNLIGFKLNVLRMIALNKITIINLNRKEFNIKDTMRVLDALLILYKNSSVTSSFSKKNIIDEVFGANWLLHRNRSKIEKDVQLSLESLEINEDIFSHKNSYGTKLYLPTGKAMLTLNQYYLEERRFKQSQGIQKKMFLATLFSALAAAASAYAAFK